MTQRAATYIYEHSNIDGIAFASRLGDDLLLWAIFEQAEDPAVSPRLTHIAHYSISADSAEIREVFGLFALSQPAVTTKADAKSTPSISAKDRRILDQARKAGVIKPAAGGAETAKAAGPAGKTPSRAAERGPEGRGRSR